MRLSVRLLLLIGILTSPALFARPLTPDDLVTLSRLDDPRLSPDGKTVLYGLRVVDNKTSHPRHELWLVDSHGDSPPRRLTISDNGAHDGRWSADGRHIYFLSGRSDDREQLFITDLEGETARPVTHLPLDIDSYALSPDGKSLIAALDVFVDCPDLACSQTRLQALAKPSASGQLYDHLMVRHWDHWSDGRHSHLFALPLTEDGAADGTPRDLMAGMATDSPVPPFGDDSDFTISPDGQSLFFTAKQVTGSDDAWTTNGDIFEVPLDGSAPPHALTAANLAWDGTPVVSPDGRWLAYRASRRPGAESDRFEVMLLDRTQGTIHSVTPHWDRSVEALRWSPDGHWLYAEADELGQTKLFRIDPAAGSVTAVTDNGHVGGFDIGPNGIVYLRDDLSHPARLFLDDPQQQAPRLLVDPNQEKVSAIDWGSSEQFSFPGWNNEIVHGYVVRPADFDPTHHYPVAFLIHGGPEGSFGNNFHYRWNAETLSGAGYAVVMIDFHGSTGYGQAFTDSINRHWGDRPLEDLQKGWAYALAHYPFLDGNRACALGGSYGGYMIHWINGNWGAPWKCLVAHDGPVDTRFMAYSTEELWFSEWENGGRPDQPGNDAGRFNPIDHVDHWQTPTLVIEGGRDFRVPLDQALASFTALQRRGIPSQFLYFPDENHWVLKPQNSVQWYQTVLAWLDRWTAP